MLTPTQKQTAQSVINFFETSEVLGDYGNVTNIAGGTRGRTHQRPSTVAALGGQAWITAPFEHDLPFSEGGVR